jgi:excisionase family DNA binding protein
MTAGRSTPAATREQLWSIDQIATVLGVDVRHVRRLVQERRIPYVKWGHLLRFDPQAIDDWLDSHRVDPAKH